LRDYGQQQLGDAGLNASVGSHVDSAAPVERSAPIVSDREDVNLSFGHQVGDVVGKPGHPYSSHVEVLGQPVDRRSGSRPPNKKLDSSIDRRQESEAQAGVALLVPLGGVFELSGCLRCESDLLALTG
jgi:hypothetical protein